MKGKLGIFTRNDQSCCQWLMRSLEYSSAANSVNYYYISNSFSTFQDNVRNCTLAILYHSRTLGRLNLTDVTDSLYDKELQHLHDKLGKDNVIVVIDDVESVETEILEQQPKLRHLAHATFLFSNRDRSVQVRADTEDAPLIASNNMEGKIKQIVKMIQAHNKRLWWKYVAPLVFGICIGLLSMVLIGLMVYEEATFNHKDTSPGNRTTHP